MSSSEESEDELFDVEWNEEEPAFDYEDSLGMSPQHRAVLADDVECLQALLKAGKSVNVNNNNGNTPLHLAVRYERQNVFDYLITLDETRIDAENFQGITPLLQSSFSDKSGHYTLNLIDKGAKISAICNAGMTCLHYAAASDNVLTGKILIEKGANINAQNYSGETPLYVACQRNKEDFIHLLLLSGANVSVPDFLHILPFTLSLSNCREEVQEILFNYTFADDDVKIPVDLYIFKAALLADSSLFYKIMGKTSELIYNDDNRNLKNFYNVIPQIKNLKLLKDFMLKFENVVRKMLSTCNVTTQHLLEVMEYPVFVDFFNILCENGIAVEFTTYNYPVVDNLIDLGISEDIFTKLMCCLLSYGFSVTFGDINRIYQRFGHCEIFETMLHMEISGFDNLNSFPKLIRKKNFSKFFASFKVVPTLLELSRDAARGFIIEKYNIKKSVHFYTVMKWLPISQVYKDILCYKKEIY